LTKLEEPVEGDRRVRRTRRQLRDALVALTLERGWDAVSVRDVCERADVGRSTFYVHFADKENLLLSGFDDLHAALEHVRRERHGAFDFIEPLALHAQENRRIMQALVGRQSGKQVEWRFRDVLSSLVEAELEALKVKKSERKAAARFIAGGMAELLLHWLEHPKPDDAKKVAAELCRFALGIVRTCA